MGLALQGGATTFPVFAACGDSEEVVARITADTPVRVISSLVGDQACYKIAATAGGKPVEGYVIGQELPAITVFERDRARNSRIIVPAPPPPPPKADTPKADAAADVPPAPTRTIDDFLIYDITKQAQSFSSLRAKYVLLFFYAPKGGKATAAEAQLVGRLQGRFSNSGLAVLAVAQNTTPDGLLPDYEDSPYANLRSFAGPSANALARRNNVGPGDLPTSVVVDRNRQVVGDKLKGDALEKLVVGLFNRK